MISQLKFDSTRINGAKSNERSVVVRWVTYRIGQFINAVAIVVNEPMAGQSNARFVFVDFTVKVLPSEFAVAVRSQANGMNMDLNGFAKDGGEGFIVETPPQLYRPIVASLGSADVINDRTDQFTGVRIKSTATVAADVPNDWASGVRIVQYNETVVMVIPFVEIAANDGLDAPNR
jgi:hypothetical protein